MQLIARVINDTQLSIVNEGDLGQPNFGKSAGKVDGVCGDQRLGERLIGKGLQDGRYGDVFTDLCGSGDIEYAADRCEWINIKDQLRR